MYLRPLIYGYPDSLMSFPGQIQRLIILLECDKNWVVCEKSAHVAQPVELLICNQRVGGSSPSVGSISISGTCDRGDFLKGI